MNYIELKTMLGDVPARIVYGTLPESKTEAGLIVLFDSEHGYTAISADMLRYTPERGFYSMEDVYSKNENPVGAMEEAQEYLEITPIKYEEITELRNEFVELFPRSRDAIYLNPTNVDARMEIATVAKAVLKRVQNLGIRQLYTEILTLPQNIAYEQPEWGADPEVVERVATLEEKEQRYFAMSRQKEIESLEFGFTRIAAWVVPRKYILDVTED